MENLLKTVAATVSENTKEKLTNLSSRYQIPVSRLLGHLIDREFSLNPKDPFLYDCSLPKDYDPEESEYSNEASKILKYMRDKNLSAGYDLLILMRHDMGVPSKKEFSYGFLELKHKKFIETVKPGPKARERNGKDYVYYRPVKNKIADRNKRHELFKQLKKEFENE